MPTVAVDDATSLEIPATLTTSEAARVLCVDRKTIIRWVADDGRLDGALVGTRWIITGQSVARFLTAHGIPATVQAVTA